MLEWRFCSGGSPKWRKICRRSLRVHQRQQLQQGRDQRRFSQCSSHLPMQGWYLGLPLDVFFKLQLARSGFIHGGGRNMEIPEGLHRKGNFPPGLNYGGEKVHSGPLAVPSFNLAPWKFLMLVLKLLRTSRICAVSPSNLFVLHFCPKSCLTCHFLQKSQK